MESKTPKPNQEHNETCDNKCGEPRYTFKEWIRDPNGILAICTIILVIIGFRALRISEDTEKRQLRAYVTPGITISGKDIAVDVDITVENFGQTPAKNCNIRGIIDILPFPLPERYNFNIPSAPFAQKTRVDPRREGVAPPYKTSKRFTLTNEALTAILSKDIKRRIYIVGIVDYTDVFNEPHYTNFCYSLIFDNLIPRKDAPDRFIATIRWQDCDQHTDFD